MDNQYISHAAAKSQEPRFIKFGHSARGGEHNGASLYRLLQRHFVSVLEKIPINRPSLDVADTIEHRVPLAPAESLQLLTGQYWTQMMNHSSGRYARLGSKALGGYSSDNTGIRFTALRTPAQKSRRPGTTS